MFARPVFARWPVRPLMIGAAVTSTLIVGGLIAFRPLFVLSGILLPLLLSVGLLNPTIVLAILIVTDIDRVQSSVDLWGFTVSQSLSLIFIGTALLRSLAKRRSLQALTPTIGALLLFMLLGLVVLPLIGASSREVEDILGLSTNLARILIVLAILLEVRSIRQVGHVIRALEVLALVISTSAVLAYLFPEHPLVSGAGVSFYAHQTYLRTTGLGRDANYTALVLTMLLPFFLLQLSDPPRRHRLVGVVNVLCLLLVCSAVLATGSRTGFATMLMVGALWLALSRRGLRQWVVIGLVGLSVMLQKPFEQIVSRAVHFGSFAASVQRDVGMRLAVVEGAVDSFLRFPIFGLGWLPTGFHSVYWDAMFFYGLFGFSAFLLGFLYVAWGLLVVPQKRDTSPQIRQLRIAVGISLVAFLIFGLSIGALSELVPWVVFGLGLVLIRNAQTGIIDKETARNGSGLESN